MSEEVNNQDTKNKSIFSKLKNSVDDKEEQLEILSTFVRLAILVWSGGILTLAYIKLPVTLGIPEQKLDPTFIASVFTGVLATFGVQAAKKAGENGGNGGGISKEDLEKLIDAAAQTAPAQTIRVEQGPIRIANGEPPIKPVPIDPPKPPYSL
jgi:hypothetical protein